MTTINLERLRHAILEVLDESIQDQYDIDIILKSAVLCWDDTCVEVKSVGFKMVFNLISYELEDYIGYDL